MNPNIPAVPGFDGLGLYIPPPDIPPPEEGD